MITYENLCTAIVQHYLINVFIPEFFGIKGTIIYYLFRQYLDNGTSI